MRNHTLVLAVSILALVVAAPGAVSAQHGQHYVLDAFGGVHAGGGAPVISPPTPYFGFDVAADIEYIPVATANATGDGILVLDKFGGVHKGGALAADPPSGGTPYFGFDAARAVVYRDIPVRAEGNATGNNMTLTSSSYAVVRGESIRAPDDGYILVVATTSAFCDGASGAVTAQFSLNVDGLGGDPSLDAYYADFTDCSVTPPVCSLPSRWFRLRSCFPSPPAFTRSFSSAAGSEVRRA